jgi:hypothetical protein
MKMALSIILATVFLIGCSTYMSPRYSIEPDNTIALRNLNANDIGVADFTGPDEFSSSCRGGGPIAPPDDITFAEYIREALADELKVAGLYNRQSPKVTLTGKIDTLDFSTNKGITGGEWNISITLTSSNGKSLVSSEHYEFKAGFAGETACKQTAEAFMYAVQNLIAKVIKSDEFKGLLT